MVLETNSLPFMAWRMTQEHAKTYSEKYPLASDSVIKSTYQPI